VRAVRVGRVDFGDELFQRAPKAAGHHFVNTGFEDHVVLSASTRSHLDDGVREVGAREVGALEVGAREVGVRKVGEPEVGALEVGVREVGAREVGAP